MYLVPGSLSPTNAQLICRKTFSNFSSSKNDILFRILHNLCCQIAENWPLCTETLKLDTKLLSVKQRECTAVQITFKLPHCHSFYRRVSQLLLSCWVPACSHLKSAVCQPIGTCETNLWWFFRVKYQ